MSKTVDFQVLLNRALRDRRVSMGVRELARKAGVDHAQISRFLSTGHGLSIASLERVLAILPIQISLRATSPAR